MHIGTEVSDTELFANKHRDVISYSPKLVLKVSNKKMKLVSGCVMFRSILPKEYSKIFYELPWGLHKEMPTNIMGQSDIVTHSTNI
jgi:hypothetical protein